MRFVSDEQVARLAITSTSTVMSQYGVRVRVYESRTVHHLYYTCTRTVQVQEEKWI